MYTDRLGIGAYAGGGEVEPGNNIYIMNLHGRANTFPSPDLTFIFVQFDVFCFYPNYISLLLLFRMRMMSSKAFMRILKNWLKHARKRAVLKMW